MKIVLTGPSEILFLYHCTTRCFEHLRKFVLLTVTCLLPVRKRDLHSETEDRVMPPVSDEEPGLGQEGTLNRADCLCPICLEIFLEPVTLPCTHTFCKPCFLETVDKANICCPLCRKRVSTWARLNSRNKTLVNTELWRRIQDAFPTQCQRRLNGVGEEEEDVNGKLDVQYVLCKSPMHRVVF